MAEGSENNWLSQGAGFGHLSSKSWTCKTSARFHVKIKPYWLGHLEMYCKLFVSSELWENDNCVYNIMSQSSVPSNCIWTKVQNRICYVGIGAWPCPPNGGRPDFLTGCLSSLKVTIQHVQPSSQSNRITPWTGSYQIIWFTDKRPYQMGILSGLSNYLHCKTFPLNDWYIQTSTLFRVSPIGVSRAV